MKNRFVAVISAFILLFGLILLTVTPAVAQSTTGAAVRQYEKLTAWGDPDLQGIWSYASLTPLQRPVNLGEKAFYTPAEASEINARSLQESSSRPGDVGTYNVEWFDRGEISSDLRTSLIVDPADGRLPLQQQAIQNQTERAAYQQEHPADSWLDRTNWDRCITYHGVPPVSSGYNNSYRIIQSPDHVAIVVEMIHDVRIIPLDGRPGLDQKIRQWNGDSRGYWDGDTLVVETSNFSDKTQHRFPSSRNTLAIERFTRVADDMIDYQFTIEDPDIYTRAWTAVRPMPALEDYVQYEYACHEGNYAMANILRGERILEQRAAQASSER